MAKHSLSKSTSKLNLNRRQTSLLQKIIFVGNQMSELLEELEYRGVSPKTAKQLSERWKWLMAKLANLLL